jgi:hypothetical protein
MIIIAWAENISNTHDVFFYYYLISNFRQGYNLIFKISKISRIFPKMEINNAFSSLKDEVNNIIWQPPRVDWPYKEVGKIPRGSSSLRAPKAIGGPPSKKTLCEVCLGIIVIQKYF